MVPVPGVGQVGQGLQNTWGLEEEDGEEAEEENDNSDEEQEENITKMEEEESRGGYSFPSKLFKGENNARCMCCVFYSEQL